MTDTRYIPGTVDHERWIVELREAERDKLQCALIDALPVLVWICDRNDLDITKPCEAAELCGLRDCEQCGCLLDKLHRAQRALNKTDGE